MRWRQRLFLFILIVVASLVAVVLSNIWVKPRATLATEAILQPAPTQQLGNYDYFGKSLTPQEAAQLVSQKGLNPADPVSYQRIGAIEITQELLNRGEDIFFNRKIGDAFGLQRVFGFAVGLTRIAPEITKAIIDLRGQPTSNLVITLQKDFKIGSRTFPKGSVFPTGLDVEKGAILPIGLKLTGDLSCAICHAVVSPTGQRLKGVPNGDLAIPFFIALAPNSAAGFARLNFNPLDPKYKGNGKKIIDSTGQIVELPDPQKFEAAFDDAVLDVPFGNFESSPDTINNTTQIPSTFTFKSGPYLFDGQFAVGPFGGLTAQTNSVYSSEINLLAGVQISAETIGIDPEVYLGTLLQNAADPTLRLPPGAPVKPSQWLRKVAPNIKQAELEDQIPAPGTGAYPALQPSLFTYNGLILSPNTNSLDRAKGPFLFGMNAISAWENTLVPPPNKTPENQQALANGSVQRGAQIFKDAGCVTCHIPPFFTDNKIHPNSEIGANPARGESRVALNDLLVAPKLYSLNTRVPVPANAEVLDLPTDGISASPTTLPNGLLPDGGYKSMPLRGLYLSAPYLHDGGVAVRAGAIQVTASGITVVDSMGLGLTGTLSRGIPADSANSLRALIDRGLRTQVIAANKANPSLVRSNLDGTGHNFYVDDVAKQTDLINFLLALDDNPGQY
jgi:Na+-transporting methylmalonyl-CoA/oxaloacetate decarboxylase gamma subunit